MVGTASDTPRNAVLGELATSVVRGSLALFESLGHEQRAQLKEMLSEFLDTENAEERKEILVSILEFCLPDAYFSIEDSASIDGWAEADDNAKAALDRLGQRKREFASRLELILAEKGITQEQLAERLGVTQPTVSAILSGQHKPQPRTLSKLSEALGVKVEALWPQ